MSAGLRQKYRETGRVGARSRLLMAGGLCVALAIALLCLEPAYGAQQPQTVHTAVNTSGLGEAAKTLEDLPSELRDAITAYRDGDVARALPVFTRSAESGSAIAQSYLGKIYAEGKGVPVDMDKAVYWYVKAADQGEPGALYAMGLFAELGKGGLTQNFKTAAKWYERAAAKSHPIALFQLGMLYAEGLGVSKNMTKAVELFEESGRLGHVDAQFTLGVLYLQGDGVEKDPHKALDWFSRAGAKGDADAQFNMGVLYLGGLGIEPDLTQAAYWLKAASMSGLADAQFLLGVATYNGDGVHKSKKEAAELFQKAAAQGHAEAQFFLAQMLAKGDGVEKDLIESYKWLELSQRRGVPDLEDEIEKWRTGIESIMTKEQIETAKQRAKMWQPVTNGNS